MDNPLNQPQSATPRNLDIVQRWFQTVIAHPEGVKGGVASAAAQKLIPIQRGELEKVIRRSKNLTAAERVGVYANAYYVRLLECLRESFPVLARAMGDELFNDFAFEYLARYPSRSYTLGRLGDQFARFLEETRPDRPSDGSPPPVGWPDFLIDLCRLEWTIEQVFDGPGSERQGLLRREDLLAIPPARWPGVRLIPAPSLVLLKFRYPVNAYFTAARGIADDSAAEVPVPPPCEVHIALVRRDYIVRRHELNAAQFVLLGAIQSGQPLGGAIAAAAEAGDLSDEQLAVELREWFMDWTASGFFRAVE